MRVIAREDRKLWGYIRPHEAPPIADLILLPLRSMSKVSLIS